MDSNILKILLQTKNMPELVKLLDENADKKEIQQAYLEKLLENNPHYQLLQKFTSTIDPSMLNKMRDLIIQQLTFDPVYQMLGNGDMVADCGCGDKNKEGE